MNIPPFPSEIQNLPFVYLCKAATVGLYNLFVAVPVAAGWKLSYFDADNTSIDQPTMHYNNNILVAGFRLEQVAGDLENYPERMCVFVFRNFQASSNSTLIKVGDMQFLECGDADVYSNMDGDIVINAPYLFFRGLMKGAKNIVKPVAILPLTSNMIVPNSTVVQLDNAASNMVTQVNLTTGPPSSAIRWELAQNIGEYELEAGEDDGAFEIQVHSLASSNVRKTKVRNKNKTAIGGGRGFGRHISHIFKRVTRSHLKTQFFA
jgi:hypothetical protein